MTDSSGRHAAISVIEGYIAKGLDGVLGVAGEPPGRIVIDPHRRELAIRFPAGGRIPNLAPFENLDVDVVEDDGTMWDQMSVTFDNNVGEVYAVLCGVLDKVQLSGHSFADAVSESVESLSDILAVRHGLAIERQVGLFGEILVLLAASKAFTPETAVAAWRGPLGEEHDFGLAALDLEVKTTLGETRQHWISGITQLQPTQDRPLYLASIQLTTSAVEVGWTLPSLVSQARADLSVVATELNRVLGLVGYADREADLYRASWTLRTLPAFFEVNAEFPAITRARLNAAVPDPQRVCDLRYRIDLTAMRESQAPLNFEHLIHRGNTA